MDRGLVWLALRRTLSRGVLVSFALLAVVLVRREWAGGAAPLEAGEGLALARGLARSGVWLGLLLLALAACVGRAASIVGRWRGGEVDWLAPRALSRTGAALSCWLGVVLGGLGLLVGAALCAELAAGGAPATFASAGVLEGRAVQRLEGGERVRFALADPGSPRGARLALELGLRLEGGTTSELALRARRLGPAGRAGPWSEVRRHLGSRARVELDLPSGPGPIEVEVERLGPGALLVLAPRAELWVPAASEALGSARLVAQGGMALAALSALAFGLAAWTRPALGLGLLATLAAALLLSGAGPLPWAPGSELPAALAAVQEGRVPRGHGGAELAGAVLVTCAGLLLAVTGHIPWRRGA